MSLNDLGLRRKIGVTTNNDERITLFLRVVTRKGRVVSANEGFQQSDTAAESVLPHEGARRLLTRIEVVPTVDSPIVAALPAVPVDTNPQSFVAIDRPDVLDCSHLRTLLISIHTLHSLPRHKPRLGALCRRHQSFVITGTECQFKNFQMVRRSE